MGLTLRLFFGPRFGSIAVIQRQVAVAWGAAKEMSLEGQGPRVADVRGLYVTSGPELTIVKFQIDPEQMSLTERTAYTLQRALMNAETIPMSRSLEDETAAAAVFLAAIHERGDQIEGVELKGAITGRLGRGRVTSIKMIDPPGFGLRRPRYLFEIALLPGPESEVQR